MTEPETLAAGLSEAQTTAIAEASKLPWSSAVHVPNSTPYPVRRELVALGLVDLVSHSKALTHDGLAVKAILKKDQQLP